MANILLFAILKWKSHKQAQNANSLPKTAHTPTDRTATQQPVLPKPLQQPVTPSISTSPTSGTRPPVATTQPKPITVPQTAPAPADRTATQAPIIPEEPRGTVIECMNRLETELAAKATLSDREKAVLRLLRTINTGLGHKSEALWRKHRDLPEMNEPFPWVETIIDLLRLLSPKLKASRILTLPKR